MTPRARKIVAEVAQRNGITVAQMLAPTKSQKPAYARYEAMYLIRSLARADGSSVYSLNQIGEFFDRDHTTVLYGIARWQELSGAPSLGSKFGPDRAAYRRHLSQAALLMKRAQEHLAMAVAA